MGDRSKLNEKVFMEKYSSALGDETLPLNEAKEKLNEGKKERIEKAFWELSGEGQDGLIVDWAGLDTDGDINDNLNEIISNESEEDIMDAIEELKGKGLVKESTEGEGGEARVGCPFCKKSKIEWKKSDEEGKKIATCSNCGKKLIANDDEELQTKVNTVNNMYKRMYPKELNYEANDPKGKPLSEAEAKRLDVYINAKMKEAADENNEKDYSVEGTAVYFDGDEFVLMHEGKGYSLGDNEDGSAEEALMALNVDSGTKSYGQMLEDIRNDDENYYPIVITNVEGLENLPRA